MSLKLFSFSKFNKSPFNGMGIISQELMGLKSLQSIINTLKTLSR